MGSRTLQLQKLRSRGDMAEEALEATDGAALYVDIGEEGGLCAAPFAASWALPLRLEPPFFEGGALAASLAEALLPTFPD